MPLNLSDVSESVTFVDTTVAATPQLLDADVTLTGGASGFDGGSLVVSGVLAEDVVGIQSGGTDPGQIDVIGGNVTFGGVIIGTVAGGDGTDLSVTFNNGATTAAVDALIQNLTFSNTAGAPTLSRELTISVSQSPTNAPDFTNVTGTAENPAGFSDGFGTPGAKPAFIDFDGDGLIDAVFGSTLMYAGINDGSGGANFITGIAGDPFAAIGITIGLTPAFVDLDGDGVEELVTGAADGSFRTWKKNDSGDFVEQTGTDNPFGAFSVASDSAPTFADVDGDGDLDMVSGKVDSAGPDILSTFRNNGDGTFTELTGADNPFGSLDVGGAGASLLPALADLDNDGDLDVVVGGFSNLKTFRNNGDGTFTELTGANNPFNELNSPDGFVAPLANNAAPQFVDLDGDGDLDALFGASTAGDFFFAFLNNETVAQEISVSINDSTPPAPPVVVGVTRDTARTDGITNDNTLVFRGTAEAGATVTVFLGGTSLGNVTANSNGDWSFNHTGTVLADGSYAVTAVATDSTGNTSGASDAFNVTVDTVPPAAPVVTAITTDAGSSATDGLTSDNTLVFNGTAEAGATVQVFLNGVSLGTTTANGSGAWTFDHSGTVLTDGSYAITATATDRAGNTSGTSTSFGVIVDTVAPVAPVIAGINTDTGSSATDGLTSDNTLVFNGTAEAGATVQVFLNGVSLGTTTANGSGAWTFDHSGTVLADGSYALTATATDRAGNTSGTSSAFGVTVDTASPAAPVVTAIATDAGSSATDGVTSDNTLVFNGTAEAGATVQVFLDGVSLGTTTANGSGAWTFDHSGTVLADGTFALTATATDRAGNTSGTSTPFGVIVDTAAPVAPGIAGIANDTGSSAADGVTSDNTLVFNGTAEAGATVQVFLDGVSLGTTTANASGAWTFDHSGTVLTDGSYALTATATDRAGNTSGTSSAFGVTVDTTIAAPVIAGISTDTGSSATDGVTSDNTLVINGTAEAGATVQVFLNGVSLGTATANASGAWTFDHSGTVLADGSYALTATATDRAGNTSGTSAPFGVTIDTVAPTAPVVAGISNDTGSSATDGVTSDNTLVFNGTAEAGATVQVFLDGVSLGTATANASGAWTFDNSAMALAAGTYAITATATDRAGNTSGTSTALGVTVAPDIAIENVVPSATLLQAGDSFSINWDVTNVGGVDAPGGAQTTFYLSQDQTLDGSDPILGIESFGALTSGGTESETLAGLTIPTGLAGGFYYLIGSSGPVTGETETANNTSIIQIAISDPGPTEGNDTLFGTPLPDTISLLGGNDAYFGDNGGDTVNGDAGNDVIFGQLGDDEVDGGAGNDRVFGGQGNDLIRGGADNDSLHGEAGTDRIFGEGGEDLLRGGFLSDWLYGGADNDILMGEGGNDRLFGGQGLDILLGGNGNDTIFGAGGNDYLGGGQGNDDLRGEGGNDFLSGETGNDVLTGGDESDRFIFRDGFGLDVITDFEVNTALERIDLSNVAAITDQADLFTNHMFQVGSDVEIRDLLGNVITVQNVTLADLQNGDDFLF